ncbi:MAG TPA: cation:proton antiporter [Chitinophaga sp.]
MKRNWITYPLIIGVFGCLIWLIIQKGTALSAAHQLASLSPVTATIGASDLAVITKAVTTHAPAAEAKAPVLPGILKNLQTPLALLLLQIITIVTVARLAGRLVRLIGQPSVVGEIIAGILLGPSLLGWIAPGVSAFLFPVSSLVSLQFLSQIGLAFFMFIVGMELDLSKIRQKAHDAVMISHASIIFPFFLGVSLAYFIYVKYAPAHISFLAFSLFMGIAMSITAFPVLARIVQERKLTGTPLGNLAITCAAADDITAWCILASVVAIVKSTGLANALLTLLLALGYVALMWYAVRPFIARVMNSQRAKQNTHGYIALAFIVLLFSAWTAEVVGIHALFGSFLAGVIMPPMPDVRSKLTDKLEDVSVLLLLPIFFVFTGLRTQLGLLTQGHLWTTFGLIMLVAVSGKWGGSTLTAKLVGQSWPDALSIGALMNTRGLMELVALNIGYDLGILSPEIFTMMVLMALCTTFMTGPLLNMVSRRQRNHRTAMA